MYLEHINVLPFLGTHGLHELLVPDLPTKVAPRTVYEQPRQSAGVFVCEVDPRQSLDVAAANTQASSRTAVN